MSVPLNIHDYERLAAERVDPRVWSFFEGGAGDETTLRDSRAAYERWRFRPRVLVDVRGVSTETTVLGTPLAMPFLISPVAYHRLLDPDGETATARAAAKAGTIMIVSTFTTCSHGEIAAAAPGLVRWAQLYVLEDEGMNRAYLDEAVESGCTAVVLTADAPVLGRRERDKRLGFSVPADLPLPYGQGAQAYGMAHPRGQQLSGVSPSVTWHDIERISETTKLPVVVKGILTREDAVLAAEHGAAAIIVSNHGGRQLDGTPASLDALPEVVEGADGKIEVLVDGGIRRGTDVLKALALGARAAMSGRAPIFGLAAAGEQGVAHVLELLQEEIRTGLALLGCTAPDQVGRDHVTPALSYDLRT